MDLSYATHLNSSLLHRSSSVRNFIMGTACSNLMVIIGKNYLNSSLPMGSQMSNFELGTIRCWNNFCSIIIIEVEYNFIFHNLFSKFNIQNSKFDVRDEPINHRIIGSSMLDYLIIRILTVNNMSFWISYF